MLENYGLKFGANLHEIHHVARELDLPIINIVGADGVNAVTEQNAFSRPGFGMATGRMQYGRNAQREPFHVRVTYELKDERAARDWYREVKRQLDNATAPIQF